MIFLRKLTLVLAEILLLVAVSVVLLAPELLSDISAFLIENTDETMRIIAAIVIDLLLIGAIFSQIRGANRYKGEGLLVQAGDSDASIATESVRQGVMKAVGQIPDIHSVECKAIAKNGEAILQLEVVTSKDDINIPKKQREIDRAINQVVVKQMGVKMARPASVNIQLSNGVVAPPKSATPAPLAAQPTAKPVTPVAPVSSATPTPVSNAPTTVMPSPTVKQDAMPAPLEPSKPLAMNSVKDAAPSSDKDK